MAEMDAAMEGPDALKHHEAAQLWPRAVAQQIVTHAARAGRAVASREFKKGTPSRVVRAKAVKAVRDLVHKAVSAPSPKHALKVAKDTADAVAPAEQVETTTETLPQPVSTETAMPPPARYGTWEPSGASGPGHVAKTTPQW